MSELTLTDARNCWRRVGNVGVLWAQSCLSLQIASKPNSTETQTLLHPGVSWAQAGTGRTCRDGQGCAETGRTGRDLQGWAGMGRTGRDWEGKAGQAGQAGTGRDRQERTGTDRDRQDKHPFPVHPPDPAPSHPSSSGRSASLAGNLPPQPQQLRQERSLRPACD